ncbi:unnamed protein product [Calypogeia fissa]
MQFRYGISSGRQQNDVNIRSDLKEGIGRKCMTRNRRESACLPETRLMNLFLAWRCDIVLQLVSPSLKGVGDAERQVHECMHELGGVNLGGLIPLIR